MREEEEEEQTKKKVRDKVLMPDPNPIGTGTGDTHESCLNHSAACAPSPCCRLAMAAMKRAVFMANLRADSHSPAAGGVSPSILTVLSVGCP